MATNSVSEEKLRKLLRKLREEQNLTQLEIAELTGQPQQVISKIERGHRRLYATQLFDYVEKGFGMKPSEFAKRLEKSN